MSTEYLLTRGISVLPFGGFIVRQSKMPASNAHVVVIGAGVIGLQTAVTFLENGYRVTVIAKHVPGDKSSDYTSPWAGAQWRTHSTAQDLEYQKWDLASYTRWFQTVDEEKKEPGQATKSGLATFNNVVYWTENDEEIANGPENVWFAPHMRSFEVLPKSSLLKGAIAGARYDAISIDTTVYLPFLVDRITSLKGRIIKAELPTANGQAGALAAAARLLPVYDINTPISAFVNASGILARELVPDPAVHPIRGQTVLVRGIPAQLRTIIRGQGVSYVIPRAASNSTILGGTKQVGNWSQEPDDATTKWILESCKELAPELLNEKGEFEVLSVNVGFRPGRTGGPRLEVEEVQTEAGKFIVCHEYGHAGAGYQLSFGSAEKVLGLLNDHFEKSATRSKL
ncbi:uncharacterized protein IWZ02DRAFT_455067 [Phyllosticta citriasiana]|uniref:FAD dependent oxidoreductase domain-containing protein n=1 Tax=Phyllosticta citriasiana TaxID=595635 RepID=A0ABR1KKZ5_9PEZI